MSFSNAVKSYFTRNWTRQDLMNSGEIPQHAHTILNDVYLTLFSAMLAATWGFFKYLIWDAGVSSTVFSAVGSSLLFYFTPAWRVTKRVLFLMCAAYNFGVSFGLLTNYLFGIDQLYVFSLLTASTICIGTFWSASFFTRERREIYIVYPVLSGALMLYPFFLNAIGILESYAFRFMLMGYAVNAFFMGYLVVYSQEILYDARFGDIDYVNRTFTVFFHLPAVVVHATRLYLGAEIEQHRQN